jgi:pimeloyl-ACP methyl ester carboxylesterase
VVLAGHSLGGAIALALGLQRPEWLEGLVLVGTGCRLRVLPEILEGILQDYPATVSSLAAMAFGPKTSEDAREAFRRGLERVPPEVTHGDFCACNRFDLCGELAHIDRPALVIAGDADRLTPVKYGAFLADHLPRARLEVLPDAGHMMALERPGPFVDAIRRFLKALS